LGLPIFGFLEGGGERGRKESRGVHMFKGRNIKKRLEINPEE